MFKKIPLLTMFLSFCLSSAAFAEQIQFENQMIQKINVQFSGGDEDHLDSQAVLSRLKTKEGDVFSQTDFDSDLKILASDFDRVEPDVESLDNNVIITLKIWTKPTIRSIRWCGNHKVETKDLQEEFGIAVFTVYDRLEFSKAVHKLKAYYVKKGFFEVEIEYDAVRDPICNEIDIEIAISEGRSGRIKDIIFHNFTCEEETEILDMMISKKWSIFTSWLTEDGTYREEVIQQDEYTILNYLQNEGYADAQVKIDVVEAESNHRIFLHITADKGEQYVLGKLSFEGNTLFCDEDIWQQFTICEGDAYSPDEIRQTILNITDLYGRRGYIDTYVDYEPVLKDGCYSYSIHFSLNEGDQFRVGLIKVFGNCSTQTNVILHETLLIPGEIFNIEKLKLTEEKLTNIGYFEHVNVYAVNSSDSCLGGNYRDVHIEVEETSTGSFGLSFGFSSLESIFGSFHITEKNFNFKGLSRVWDEGYQAMRGGGEYANLNFRLGSKSHNYTFSWAKPYFMDTPWIVGFDIEQARNRYISKDYDIESWMLVTHAKYLINSFLAFGWHYRLKNSNVKVVGNVPTAEEDPERDQIQSDGIISATGISLQYDSTGATGGGAFIGLRSSLNVEYAGLGGWSKFYNFSYLNSIYFKIGEKGVLKYRLDGRFIQPIGKSDADNLPLDERLFLGGDNVVRGYRQYALGPQFTNGDPKGGISMVIASGEYVYTFFKKMDGFLFADVGQLSQRHWNLSDDLFASAGFGVRLKVMEGGPPLVIGMGYPLNKGVSRSDIKRFFFAIGGNF